MTNGHRKNDQKYIVGYNYILLKCGYICKCAFSYNLYISAVWAMML